SRTGPALGGFLTGGSAALGAVASPGMAPLNGSGLGAVTGRVTADVGLPGVAAADTAGKASQASVVVARSVVAMRTRALTPCLLTRSLPSYRSRVGRFLPCS